MGLILINLFDYDDAARVCVHVEKVVLRITASDCIVVLNTAPVYMQSNDFVKVSWWTQSHVSRIKLNATFLFP